MKPVDFTLHRPETLEAAVQLLGELEDVKLLAGGQSLVPLLNFRLARPVHVVDLGRIASLRRLGRSADGLSIGAMVRYVQAQRSEAVATAAPLLNRAFPHIAHQAIRARGTIGGSVAHGDPAAEIPAVMRALDAVVVATGPDGVRRIPAEDFFIANLVTSLRESEILTAVEIAACPARTGASLHEVSRRSGDFALVGVAAQVSLGQDGLIVEARIALTGVSAQPHRAGEAEVLLIGHAPDRRLFVSAAEATQSVLSPSTDLHADADYRRDVAGTLIARALADACADAMQRQDRVVA